MTAKLKEIKEEVWRRMHQSIPEQGQWLKQVVTGYFAYHAVPTNIEALRAFRFHVVSLWGRALRRRSQKDGTTWKRILKIADAAHADGCMYGDNILEVTPDGKTVWEWHACRDMEVEKYPLISNQLRDEFAHANAISPLPNGDIYISFRRLNMIGLIDKQTNKMKWQHRDDSFGMQHDCAPLAERQHHAVRQRHQHHRPIRSRA